MRSPPVPNGHTKTLIASFLHFDVCFMLWVLLGALGIYIADSLGLSPSQKGLLVAIPILSGTLLRIPLGLLSDRVGAKRIGVFMLAFLFLPLTIGWQAGNSLPALAGIGLMLGTAGASFAVAIPLASRWYPAHRQGLVMGIVAAGNSGTIIANLAAPRVAQAIGWHNVLGLAMLPLALVLVAFCLMAKDSPNRATGQSIGQYLSALKRRDLWLFSGFYCVTFGGYVGLSTFLPTFLHDQYQVSPVKAGYLTAICAFAGSGLRPIGGFIADRFGGVRVLTILLLLIGVSYIAIAQLPGLALMMTMLVLIMACLGMGNGSVFQLVPQRFRKEIGVAAGTVGALGGLGGFSLPILLGDVKESGGSFGPGFLILGLVAFGALALLLSLVIAHMGWRSSWQKIPQPAREEAGM